MELQVGIFGESGGKELWSKQKFHKNVETDFIRTSICYVILNGLRDLVSGKVRVGHLVNLHAQN